MTATDVKLTWTERYRRDPDLAQSIIEALQRSLAEEHERADRLESALEQIRDCISPGSLPYTQNRADWMRKVAKEALE